MTAGPGARANAGRSIYSILNPETTVNNNEHTQREPVGGATARSVKWSSVVTGPRGQTLRNLDFSAARTIYQSRRTADISHTEKPDPNRDPNTLTIMEVRRRKKRPPKSSRRGDMKSSIAFQFPFLSDNPTIDFVKKTKVMFVMRGLQGSGKSTIADLLTETYPGAVVCSADHYFMRSGVYNFDGSLLSEAHKQSQATATDACKSGRGTVIIDNTNVEHWEMKPYLDLASFHGYLVVIVTPKTPWRLDPDELARRSPHRVPLHVIRRKLHPFTSLIPLYWGWFVCQEDSSRLCGIGRQCFTQCLRQVREFSTALKTSLRRQGKITCLP